MRHVMVRYTVKPDQVAHNQELVRAVYEELRESQPDGIRYATFQAEDGRSFIHIAETEEDHNPLPQLQAFKDFQAGIADRCEIPPVATTLSEVGSFRLFS